MNPKPPTPPKKRVTLFVWISLIIDIISDLLKILLFFLNAIIGVGTAIDFAGSIIVSLIEIAATASNFFASGLYRNGSGSLTNILLTGGIFGIDMVPVLDDLPITSIGTSVMIFNAKRAEKHDRRIYEAELHKYNEEIEAIQAARIRAAQIAAQNAANVPENIRMAA